MTGEELAAAIAAHEAIIEVETGPPGPQGERGPEGPSGRDGEDGDDGHDGDRGPVGPRGEIGANGQDGPPGKDGRDGDDGRDGQDGKDGADADPATVRLFDDGIRKADTNEIDFTGEGVQVREKNGRAQVHIPGPPRIALHREALGGGGGGGGVTVHSGLAGLSADDHPHYAQSTHTHAGGGGVNLAASNTTYSSGTVILSGGANVTVGTNGQTVTISAAAQSVQTQNMVAISASDALFSSGTVVMSGFGAATVNTAAGTIRISVPVQSAQTGISSIAASDATYTSGQVQFTGSGNVTVRSSAGQRVVIDATQSVQTQNMIAATVAGNSTSAGAGFVLVSSGTMTLAGGNNITLSQNGNAVTISGPTAGGAQTAISGIAASNTTYTSGSVTISGVGGGVTVSSNTGQRIDISVAAPVAQSVQPGIQHLVVSNTTFSSGTVSLSGFGDVTVNTAANIIRISAPVQTAQTGISGFANSETTYTSGSVTLSALGALTIRSTTGQHLQFSVNSQTVQTQNMIALSASNNLYSSGTVILSGGANVTVGTNGQTVTISAAGGGGFSAGVSNLGNTAGSTGVSGTRLVLVGSQNVSLSQSTDANGATVSFSAPAGGGGGAPTLSRWYNFGPGSGAQVQSVALSGSTRSLFVFKMNPQNNVFPGNMTASTVRMLLNLSGSTASQTNQRSMGFSLGIYQISASDSASTLSLLNSVGSSWTHTTLASSAAVNSYGGTRWLTFHSSQWSSNPVFTDGGLYYGALLFSWSSVTFQTFGIHGGSVMSTFNASGTLGAASATDTSRGFDAYGGIYTVTTGAFPASIHVSQLNKQAANANFVPLLIFDNLNATQ